MKFYIKGSVLIMEGIHDTTRRWVYTRRNKTNRRRSVNYSTIRVVGLYYTKIKLIKVEN